MFTLLIALKISGIDVKFIRCNYSVESAFLRDSYQENVHKINSEFSGPKTPQHNSKVERKFQTFYERISANLNNGGLEDSVRTGIWAEFARATTLLSNISSIKTKDKCSYQIMFWKKPMLPISLRIFGEIGVVTNKDDIQVKLKSRSLNCMFVRYSVDHANDVYRMLNLNSKRIIQTRDVIWLEKRHNDCHKN
jgi:hypothetical protein